jgi:hypothetical protein
MLLPNNMLRAALPCRRSFANPICSNALRRACMSAYSTTSDDTHHTHHTTDDDASQSSIPEHSNEQPSLEPKSESLASEVDPDSEAMREAARRRRRTEWKRRQGVYIPVCSMFVLHNSQLLFNFIGRELSRSHRHTYSGR